jgi:hypothetical protein
MSSDLDPWFGRNWFAYAFVIIVIIAVLTVY